MREVNIEVANGARYEAAKKLLEVAGLPVADVTPGAVTLMVALEGESVIGCIGLETAGEFGLLRSLAVDANRRGQGLARAMYASILPTARQRAYTELYGLTNTAEGLLKKLGFEETPREDVPGPVRATAQFSSLCPASTRVFRQRLTRG